MAFCTLCSKKIGVFQESYNLFENVTICGDCKGQCDEVLDSLGKKYDDQLLKFKQLFESCENLELFIDYFNKKQNEFVEEQTKKDAQACIDEDIADSVDSVQKVKINENIGPFAGDLVYSVDGVRGRHIDVYVDKCVITTKVTLGSLLTKNATDGEKTFYYLDCIGIQFKESRFTIGYLQIETAASSGNNMHSNFFNENSFTFDTSVISNEKMMEVANFIKQRVDDIKKVALNNKTTDSMPSVADELIKMKQLLDMGVLTQEEFETQKRKLLG